MKTKGRSRKTKGGISQSRSTCLTRSIALGTVYAGLFVLLLLNSVYVYSLVGRIRQPDKGIPEERTAVRGSIPGGRTVRVEVLNGAGVEGIARTMTDFLRRRGFDVIDYGNASSFGYHETIVLDRNGNRTLTEQLARAIHTENVIEQKSHYAPCDATLILGKDYEKLAPFQDGGR